jgi:hypothetical protein
MQCTHVVLLESNAVESKVSLPTQVMVSRAQIVRDVVSCNNFIPISLYSDTAYQAFILSDSNGTFERTRWDNE